MMTTLQLQAQVTTQVEPTPRALEIAAMFGLSLDGTRTDRIIPPIELQLVPGQIVFITGVSGGGKSTLLRCIEQELTNKPACDEPPLSIVNLDDQTRLPSQPLIDALALPEGDTAPSTRPADLEKVCQWLSRAGLNDAAVMLRRPDQLSEGQRYRLRLAQAIAIAEQADGGGAVLLADEFGSSLDRTTAKALAQSVRRWVTRSSVCLVAATAHDDLLEPLDPDVLVEVAPGGQCSVHQRPA